MKRWTNGLPGATKRLGAIMGRAHLVSLIYIPPFEWSARRFGEILCLRGGIWNSILKRVLPFSRRLCKSEERFFLPAGCLRSSKFEDAS